MSEGELEFYREHPECARPLSPLEPVAESSIILSLTIFSSDWTRCCLMGQRAQNCPTLSHFRPLQCRVSAW